MERTSDLNEDLNGNLKKVNVQTTEGRVQKIEATILTFGADHKIPGVKIHIKTDAGVDIVDFPREMLQSERDAISRQNICYSKTQTTPERAYFVGGTKIEYELEILDGPFEAWKVMESILTV